MRFTNGEIIVWILNFLLMLAVLVRMRQLGIGKTYAHFRNFLVVNVVSSGFMIFTLYVLGKKFQELYGYQYIAKNYYLSVFQFLFVLEIIAQTLRPYPAIERASRNTLKAFWGMIAVIGASWYLYLTQLPPGKTHIMIRTAMRYQDAVCIGFTLFLILTLGFFTWMPVPLSSNARIHVLLSTLYFAALALSRFAAEISSIPDVRAIVGYIGNAGSIVQLVGWLFLIRPPGDGLTTVRGPLDRDEANRLLARMEKLNETLSRSA